MTFVVVTPGLVVVTFVGVVVATFIGVVVTFVGVIAVVFIAVVIICVCVVIVGIELDYAGQLPAFDGDLKPSAEFSGMTEQVAERLVGGLELRRAGLFVSGVNRREGVVDELAVVEGLQSDLGRLDADRLLTGRVQQIDRNGVRAIVVQQLGVIFTACQFDQMPAVWRF